MAFNLLGMNNQQPDPYQSLLGDYYTPQQARMAWLGGTLQGVGAGLASGRPGAWAQGAALGGGEGLDNYRQRAVAGYALQQRKDEQDYQRQERDRKAAEEQAQKDAQAAWLANPENKTLFAKAYPAQYASQYAETLFPTAPDPANRYKVVGDKIYDAVDKTWIEGGGNSWETNLPKGYRMKPDGSGAEAIPGVTVPGTPKPYVPGPGDRTAIRNAKEESAMLQQTLVNLDEASGLVGTPDTKWKPAAGQTEADRPILPNSNSGYFSTFRGKIAENVSDGFVPDSVFGSPKQGANTLRLKQIMDAEALASMGKLLKGPTSDRDVRIMLETVNDPDASPKRKQQSIDQVKRLIRAQIAANEETVEFSMNGPSGGGSQPVVTEDGYTIETVPEN